MKNKTKTLLTLFTTMLYISACTFGGGFVIVTFMKKKFADKLHYINEEEMLDYIALAQSSPGAIAVNCAILVGWKAAGFAGMLAAVLGTVIPPVAIISVISVFYAAFRDNRIVSLMLEGMQAGVAAVIADVVWDMTAKLLKKKKPALIFIMAAAFSAVFFFKVNVMLIIAAALAVGAVMAVLSVKQLPKEGTKQ